jgi:hypothetical protein
MVPWPYGGFNLEAMDSHGGWIANAIDLIRFVLAVDGFNTKPDILSPGTIQLMKTPSPVNPNYALGWVVNSAGNWWHNGSLPGTTALLVRTSVGRMCWAVLINFRPWNWWDFNADLDATMWDAINTVSTWPEHDLFDVVAIEGTQSTIEKHFRLYQNYPNPFNATTKIRYNVSKGSHVSIRVFNLSGELIDILEERFHSPGIYSLRWNASALASGIYIIEFKTPEYTVLKKSVLIK